MTGGSDIADWKTGIAERREYLDAEFERSWAAVLYDRALAAFEQPLFALDTDSILPEYASHISSVCFVGFSMGYHLHSRDVLWAQRRVTGRVTSPTAEQTAAEARTEFDRVFFPYLYQNAYATYVDALVPLVERTPKSRGLALREVCYLGFAAGYNSAAEAQENPTHRGGWRDRGQGLPPLDAGAYSRLTDDFEELWPAQLASTAFNQYCAAMSAAQEDDAIERIDVLAEACFGSFYAGAYRCYNSTRLSAKDQDPQAQATHQEWAKARSAQAWRDHWRDVAYPATLEAYMTAAAPVTADSDLGLEFMLKQVCRVAFMQGYTIGFQSLMDTVMESWAEQQRSGRVRAERVSVARGRKLAKEG